MIYGQGFCAKLSCRACRNMAWRSCTEFKTTFCLGSFHFIPHPCPLSRGEGKLHLRDVIIDFDQTSLANASFIRFNASVSFSVDAA